MKESQHQIQRYLMQATMIIIFFGVGFAGTLYFWIEPQVPNLVDLRPSGVEPSSSTRCEITFPVRACSAQPGFGGINERNVYIDDYQGSGSNQRKCLERARGFYEWCKFEKPVTARYLLGNREAAIETWPR